METVGKCGRETDTVFYCGFICLEWNFIHWTTWTNKTGIQVRGEKKHERKILTTGHNSQLAVVQTEIFSFENDTAVAPGLIWGFFRLAGPEQMKVRCGFFRTKASWTGKMEEVESPACRSLFHVDGVERWGQWGPQVKRSEFVHEGAVARSQKPKLVLDASHCRDVFWHWCHKKDGPGVGMISQGPGVATMSYGPAFGDDIIRSWDDKDLHGRDDLMGSFCEDDIKKVLASGMMSVYPAMGMISWGPGLFWMMSEGPSMMIM